MNKLILKEANQNYVIYFYLPEGEGTPGEIFMRMKDEEAEIIAMSDNDSSVGRYAHKAKLAVRERVQKRVFPLEFTQAWY